MLNLAAIAPVLGMVVKLEELWPVMATTVIFVAIGLVFLPSRFIIVVLVAPFSVKKRSKKIRIRRSRSSSEQ